MAKRLLRNTTDDDFADVSIAELKTEYKRLKTKYERLTKGYYCHECDRFLVADNFYESKDHKSGVVPTCKSCLEKIANGYDERTKKENPTEETIKEALKICNKPFLRKIYTASQERVKKEDNTSSLSVFKNMMVMLQSLPDLSCQTWADSDPEEVIYDEEEEAKISKKLKAAAVKRFGGGYMDGAYEFLQKEYEEWTARYTIESKAQEDLLVEICKVKLKLHNADINGEDTKDLIKSYQDLMASLNVRPDKKDAKGIADAKSLGQMIEMWEEHDPIPEPDDEFKDVDKIGWYINVFFKGHLSKMMGLKNAFSTMYEKFMDKYTVKKQVYKDGYTSEEMFEQIFGSVGDKDG